MTTLGAANQTVVHPPCMSTVPTGTASSPSSPARPLPPTPAASLPVNPLTIPQVLWINNQAATTAALNSVIRRDPEAAPFHTRQAAGLATLAGGIAHHFNNIVCGMSTMIEMALETEDPTTMKRALRMSADAAGRISYITQTLLACSCQQGGAPDLADLTEKILNFADFAEPRLAARGVELVLDLRAQRVAAVPRVRFAQVLEHLLRNAEEAFEDLDCWDKFRAMPRTKRLTVSTQGRDEQILVQFTDNAVGISPENLPQIFDPFFTTKGVQGGGNRHNPGLGLTLALGMVSDLGGYIWADSAPGEYTTINLLLPIVG
ncbi:MAG: HAMP domain-containing sensor histidine kinase [Phycisphaerae bacterium]